MCSGTSYLLSGCHSPVENRVCSQVVWLNASRYDSELGCEESRTGALPRRGASEYASTGAVPSEAHSVVLPTTHCAGSQSTLFLAVSPALPQSWEFRKSTWVTHRHHAHKATSADPLRSGTRTAIFTHLDPLWELLGQSRPWPHLCGYVPAI